MTPRNYEEQLRIDVFRVHALHIQGQSCQIYRDKRLMISEKTEILVLT
jgi:hypothetical protein